MKTNHLFSMLAALALALGGCSSINQAKTPAGKSQVREEAYANQGNRIGRTETILEFVARFMAFDAEEQRREFSQLQQRLALNKHDLNDRTRMAAMLTLSDTQAIKDHAKAQTLLDELSRENDPDIERHAFVLLLKDFLTENLRLTKDGNRLAQENGRLSKKVREGQDRVEMLEEKANELEQKLEELKAIEKNIGDRKVLDK